MEYLLNILFVVWICSSTILTIPTTQPDLEITTPSTNTTQKTLFENTSTTQHEHQSTKPTVLMDVVYWEQKAFIFYNKKGEMDGIIPLMFSQAQAYCIPNNDSLKMIDYVKRAESRKQFYDLAVKELSNGYLEFIGS